LVGCNISGAGFPRHLAWIFYNTPENGNQPKQNETFIPCDAGKDIRRLSAHNGKYLEDKMLQKELPGYTDYANKVRYRLMRGIW